MLVSEKRAAKLPGAFWVAAERLQMLRAVFGDSVPLLPVPAVDGRRSWERAEAVRELVRGRIEVSGPITSVALARLLGLPSSEIDGALLALESEGFVLRGKFHPGVTEIEWCDRRLLARIHRLTIHRLRAEIQPVSLAEFQRFLLAWQRVSAEHRAEGPDGVKAVLELLDGYELPAGAWEPEVLALRVKDYTPAWLDQLCFTGRIGWGRLTSPQTVNGRLASPVRSSPISIFARENLSHWLTLSARDCSSEFPPDATQVLEAAQSRRCAVFLGNREADSHIALAGRARAGRAHGPWQDYRRQFRGLARPACAGRKAPAVCPFRAAQAQSGLSPASSLPDDGLCFGLPVPIPKANATSRSRLMRECFFGDME